MGGVAALRRQFPAFAAVAPPFHYLDNAATGQIHCSALKAQVRHEACSRANVQRGAYRLATLATRSYEAARSQVARFLNAASDGEVIFTSGATAAINLVAFAFGTTLRPGDEVVVSAAEHHSNFVPWQLLRERCGATLRVLPLTADGRIDVSALPAVVTRRCRLIAVAHVSNVTGALTDVAAVIAAARAVGARVLVDGAQRVQHGPVDVQALGADFYAFSGHKCFGPTGVGVLWGRAEALETMPPLLTGGGMVERVAADRSTFAEVPRRFEAGTPPVAQAIGLGATLEWMASLPWEDIRKREMRLARRLLNGLQAQPGVHLLGPDGIQGRLPVVSFAIDGAHPHDVCQILDERGVAVRGGHLCAQPLMDALGIDGVTRASVALYNDEADIDALLAGLEDVVRIIG